MTLEEFNKMVTEASQKAHLFVADTIGGAERVRSVSLRVDDDGVLSVILHTRRMKDRIPTDEAKTIAAAVKAVRQLQKAEPALSDSLDDFDGFFVHWNEILNAMAEAGDEYTGYSESPLELITQLIDERDQLQEEVLALNRELKTEPELETVASPESGSSEA